MNGITWFTSSDLAYDLGLGPVWQSASALGIPAVVEAAAQIATGTSDVVLIVAGLAGVYTERASTAPWTRPNNEFVAPYGMFTAAEFALIGAPRHAPVRHDRRADGDRRRDHPQQRARAPRSLPSSLWTLMRPPCS